MPATMRSKGAKAQKTANVCDVATSAKAGSSKKRKVEHLANTPQKTTASGSADVAAFKSVFDCISEEVHRHIISYVVSYQSLKEIVRDREQSNYDRAVLTAQREAPQILLGNCRNFSRVSKIWKVVTADVMNLDAPTDVIATRELANIKAQAARMDLSTICPHFVKDLKKRWGSVDLEDFHTDAPTGTSALSEIVERFGGSYEAFAKIVMVEYKKFLVVKAVEHMAHAHPRDDATAAVAAWGEKCQPNKLVDMFWHAHMLSPRKYAADCRTLVGDIIDHDAGYASNHTHRESDFQSKKEVVFNFEENVPQEAIFGAVLDDDDYDIIFGMDDESFYFQDVVEIVVHQQFGGYEDCG